MACKIKIHPLVLKEDFKKINPPLRKKILATIEQRLSSNPKKYGEPLRGEFKRYYKLRVSEYRVIYEIIEDKVLVLVIKVGIRRDFEVYNEMFYRLKKLP